MPQHSWVLQAEQLGTGHAVQQALPALHDGELALVLYGDVPLIRATTLRELIALAGTDAMSLLTVLLDDPTEAWRRAHGDPVPVTFDIEWHATDGATPLDDLVPGASGYRQVGEIDAVVELLEGPLHVVGPAERVHVWGAAHLPTSFAMPMDLRGLRAPYRRSDGGLVDQVLTVAGGRARWHVAAQRGS